MALLGSVAAASAQKDLDSAAKHEKIAFILVTDQGATGVDQARDMIKQAMKQVKKADPGRTRSGRIRRTPSLWPSIRLAGAPVPLIIVAARNGVIAGGLPAAQATADKLVAMVPSPKKAEILQLLQIGQSGLHFC